MYTYNFLFLCFSLNTFFHGILACVVNFYQPTHMNWPTDKVRYRSSLSKLNKFWVHACILTTLIFYVLLTIKLFMEFQQLKVIFGLVAALIGHFWDLDWVWKQLRVLLMSIYTFPFLDFAPNSFLHGVVAKVKHFYQQIDRQMDKVRYRSSLPELKKECIHWCLPYTILYFIPSLLFTYIVLRVLATRYDSVVINLLSFQTL